MKRIFAVGVAVGLVVAGCVSCGGSSATLVATPSSALLDAPVSTTISGLDPGAPTTVTASAIDRKGVSWTSTAQFTADAHGNVSLRQPSTGGSYRGVDPMGLIETLAPAKPPKIVGVEDSVFFFPKLLQPFTLKLQASVDNEEVASTTITRKWGSVATKNESLAATGIHGNLYQPKQLTGRKPAVLVFGGSEGGQATVPSAALLAAHGYSTLALAYFKEPGLLSTLTKVPLEYFVRAIKLLAAQPGVDPNHILVWGTSRGSEAALLLGAHFPQLVHGVIASAPSSVVYGSIPHTNPETSAWTLGGATVPFAPYKDWNLTDPSDAQNAVIPVQNIRGPVLLVCGGEDRLWSSCQYTDTLQQHLGTNRPTVLKYPAAGHLVGLLLPYLPLAGSIPGRFPATGGTPIANMQGTADGWPKLLNFLAHQ